MNRLLACIREFMREWRRQGLIKARRCDTSDPFTD